MYMILPQMWSFVKIQLEKMIIIVRRILFEQMRLSEAIQIICIERTDIGRHDKYEFNMSSCKRQLHLCLLLMKSDSIDVHKLNRTSESEVKIKILMDKPYCSS